MLEQRWDGTVPKLKRYLKTPSGNRARGQLEDIVDHLCKKWMVTGAVDPTMPELCTAEWLTAAVTDIDGKETSSGAVARILYHWSQMEYAMVGEKPLRFIGLTARGMELGLEELHRIDRFEKRKAQHYQWPSG